MSRKAKFTIVDYKIIKSNKEEEKINKAVAVIKSLQVGEKMLISIKAGDDTESARQSLLKRCKKISAGCTTSVIDECHIEIERLDGRAKSRSNGNGKKPVKEEAVTKNEKRIFVAESPSPVLPKKNYYADKKIREASVQKDFHQQHLEHRHDNNVQDGCDDCQKEMAADHDMGYHLLIRNVLCRICAAEATIANDIVRKK